MADAGGPLALLKGQPLQEIPKILKQEADKWMAVQPPWVEAVATGVFGSVQGAFLGGMMGYMTQMQVNDPATAGAAASGPSAQLMKMGGPVQQARNFAVMTGVNTGMSALMKRVRGKEDIQGSMIAAFTSGAAFSLVSTLGGGPNPMQAAGAPPGNPLMAAFSSGVIFALFQGGFYKLGETFMGPKVEETDYVKVKQLLSSLGFEKYEKNVRKGLLKDNTILLWDQSALKEVGIPPGPRLVVIDHINRYRHLLRPAMPLPGPPTSS